MLRRSVHFGSAAIVLDTTHRCVATVAKRILAARWRGMSVSQPMNVKTRAVSVTGRESEPCFSSRTRGARAPAQNPCDVD